MLKDLHLKNNNATICKNTTQESLSNVDYKLFKS